MEWGGLTKILTQGVSTPVSSIVGKRQKYQNPIDGDTIMKKYAYVLRLLLALVLASEIFAAAAPMQIEAK